MTLATEPIAYMDASWLELLREEFAKPYMKHLEKFLAEEMAAHKAIYPPFELIFNAFCLTPYAKVQVVLIGQDPYHGHGQAHGLAFSVSKGVAIPPSLQNIFKELHDDLGVPEPSHGSLVDWARQGVLLLNATLTVRAHEAKSHYGQGWEIFTDRVVQILCQRRDPIVFLLWGKLAQEKFQQIDAGASISRETRSLHLVLSAPHPSPFSAHSGFLGCRHFSKTNQFLKAHGKEEIDWRLM
jgi:uracil-DNA glycosylase